MFRRPLHVHLRKASPRELLNRLMLRIPRKIEDFTSGDRKAWLIWWLIAETNNGSLDQYLFNSSGDHFYETLGLLELLKMPEGVAIFRDLEGWFPSGRVPENIATRREEMLQFNQDEEAEPIPEYENSISQLTERLRAIEVDLLESFAKYVADHQQEFQERY